MRWFKQKREEKKLSDNHEFEPLLVEIEDRPLNPAGRAIMWIIFAVIFFGSLWLYFGKVDVVVSARGKVVPNGEIKILQPIETGVIAKILAQEGEYVKKDQVLMQIDPTVTETSLESKEKDLATFVLETERLSALVNNKPFLPKEETYKDVLIEQLSLYEHLYSNLNETKAQYAMKKEQIVSQYNSAESDVLRLKGLLKKEQEKAVRMKQVLDLIAKNDYEESLAAIINYKQQLSMAQYKASEAKHHLREIEKEEKVFIEKMMSEWYMQLVEKQKESRKLEAEINAIKFQNRQQQIRSPVDGYVGKLMVHTEGGVVSPAEKLISVVPNNTPLIIKATVLNQDIGFVAEGMPVAIKIDTFTFQKYGLIDGNVTFVGNDAIEDEKLGPVYEIKIDPATTIMDIDGHIKHLEPGMSVTAEVKVGKRRIIEFFIYPIIRYLDEGVSVR